MRRNAVMQLVNLGKKAKAGGNSQLQGKNGHGGARLDGVIQKPALSSATRGIPR
jgi:hypothetical protein